MIQIARALIAGAGLEGRNRIVRIMELQVCQPTQIRPRGHRIHGLALLREGIKAILTGSIANLGNDFVITLQAQNTATGDQIASVQAQAASKEKVLDAMNQAATQMRAKLGESLGSVRRLTPAG